MGWVVGIVAAGQGDKMADSAMALSSARGMWAHSSVRRGGGTVPLPPWIICPVGSTQGCQSEEWYGAPMDNLPSQG